MKSLVLVLLVLLAPTAAACDEHPEDPGDPRGQGCRPGCFADTPVGPVLSDLYHAVVGFLPRP